MDLVNAEADATSLYSSQFVCFLYYFIKWLTNKKSSRLQNPTRFLIFCPEIREKEETLFDGSESAWFLYVARKKLLFAGKGNLQMSWLKLLTVILNFNELNFTDLRLFKKCSDSLSLFQVVRRRSQKCFSMIRDGGACLIT